MYDPFQREKNCTLLFEIFDADFFFWLDQIRPNWLDTTRIKIIRRLDRLMDMIIDMRCYTQSPSNYYIFSAASARAS